MKTRRGVRTRELSLQRSTVIILIADLIIGALLFYYMYETSLRFSDVREATEDYAEYQAWTTELKEGVEFLANAAKTYTVTQDPEQVILYYNELSVTRRRDEAYARLTEAIEDARVLKHLESVITLSDAMRAREAAAMRLVAEAREDNLDQYPAALRTAELTAEEKALSPEQKIARAQELVFSSEYENLYGQMQTRVTLSVDHLLESLQDQQLTGANEVYQLLRVERLLVYLFVIFILVAVLFVFRLVIRPLKRNIENIRNEENLEEQGASELAFLARTYNTMLEQIRKSQRQLSFEANHDSLTGLYNRNAYDAFLLQMQEEDTALLILDVDHFKGFNDTYGHDVGDKVLRRVSAALQHNFRSGDKICRIGGDEFAVLMQRAKPVLAGLIKKRIASAAAELAVPLEDAPAVTLSVGAAFSADVEANRSLFKYADMALYTVKHQGGNGCCVYGVDLKED